MLYDMGHSSVTYNADGGGWITFSGGKRYEGVRFNVIRVTRGGWVGVQFPEKTVTQHLNGPIAKASLHIVGSTSKEYQY